MHLISPENAPSRELSVELELAGLVKVFAGDVRAVDGLSLHVPAGQTLSLLGPSGCGKSTLLRLIAGLEQPTAGAVHLGGREITRLQPRDRDLALVFQDLALYPHWTVCRNLALPLQMRGAARHEIAERVNRTATLLGINDLLDRRPGELSGGQRQRVALGRAIIRQPKCFLLDEPLSQLDELLRLELRAEIQRQSRALGVTTVYVTHDQQEALALGDRVAIMRAGRLEQVDTPQGVYQRPANRFVAEFIGSPSMNFIPGRLRSRGELLYIESTVLTAPLPAAMATALSLGANHVQREIIIGIRPEDFRPSANSLPGDSSSAGEQAGQIVGQVQSVAWLGDHCVAQISAGSDQPLRVKLPPGVQIRPTEALTLRIAPERLHLFSADGAGVNLLGAS